MTMSAPAVLQALYNAKTALGAVSISADAVLEIEGFPGLLLQTKQFPWPIIGSAGEIELTLPLGGSYKRPQQIKIDQSGPITFVETQNGSVHAFMSAIANNGGLFNAIVYEGTPDNFVRAYRLKDCFFVPDQVDRDHENRAQAVLINGTLHFHFFNEQLTPNATAL